MDELYQEFQERLLNVSTTFRRSFMDKIDWNERLNMIVGARGVGKSTLMLQRIKEAHENMEEVLYVSMDYLFASHYTLLDIAKYHYEKGGRYLYIDEIHKYENWSQELKNINDKYQKLKVVASGSSILEIMKGKADLSRRAVDYEMPGLSFREYINIETECNFSTVTIEDIVTNHREIATEILKDIQPGKYFTEYLKKGYYPFYLEGKNQYSKKLNNVLNITLEVDLTQQLNVEVSKINQLKKLVYILTTQAPFTPNISKIAASIGLDRGTLTKYLNYLEKASIVKMLWNKGRSYSILEKPDKLFLHNTNLFYLANREVNIGTLRESFFVNQVSYEHSINLPQKGDFFVDDTYTFEIGGPKKSYKQIADVPDSYIVSDNLSVGTSNRIPVWLFGFLY